MGLEHFEAAPFALAAGVTCLAAFRALERTPFGQIWPFPAALAEADARHVALGAALGAAAAGVAALWAIATRAARGRLTRMGLGEHDAPLLCGALGGLVIGVLGALLPPTLFWGEFELRSIADASIPLAHIWPQRGFWQPAEPAAGASAVVAPFLAAHGGAGWFALVGIAKLAAISVTLAAGFRGGFIFPLMLAGASLGTAAHLAAAAALPADALAGAPPVVFAMCAASGLTTAVTRTPLATPLILATLSGQGNVAAPALAAALTALFLTRGMRVIATQRGREADPALPAHLWLDQVRGHRSADGADAAIVVDSPLASPRARLLAPPEAQRRN